MVPMISPEKTIHLLFRAQDGDGSAREELYRRILPRLERFAHGRLPRYLRNLADTQDLVQETVMRSLDRLNGFEPQSEGALMHYLSKVVTNRIRDFVRRPQREVSLDDGVAALPSNEPSPEDEAMRSETYRRYHEALQTLNEDQRLAVFLHVDMGYTARELADALERSPDAARKLLSRGLKQVSARMGQPAS